jgi:hypothetical protein
MTPVADKLYFSKENIEKHRFNASSVLAEQAVHCLELVAELAECGLSFQFKGGNSLLLILSEPKRFSIDVDVASNQSRDEIEAVLDEIVKKYGVFTRWERRQHKTKPWLPMTSYYMYYRSLFDSSPETNIMFDVQMRRSDYKTEFGEVCCGNLYRSTAKAELPLTSSITSDKLLTLGPATLGIPFGRGKDAQRLKHVYDVSRLAATLPDISEMRLSFDQCLKQENELQETKYTVMDIVRDTLPFLYTTAPHDIMPESSDNIGLSENIKGLVPFAGHLFESDYDWAKLRRDMARSAICMSAVGNESVTNEMMNALLTSDANVAKMWETIREWWGGEAFWDA